jgi:hypothetical protein
MLSENITQNFFEIPELNSQSYPFSGLINHRSPAMATYQVLHYS